MRAVWVDAGNDPDYVKLSAFGITVPYFDPRDPRVTADYLDDVAEHAGIETCGLYIAWNWYPALDGKGFAEECHGELGRVAWRGNPPLCADIEVHDPTYLATFAQRWRQLRPKRATWLTTEGMQGGWLESVSHVLIGASIRLAPQFYRGDMTPLAHSPIIDLLMAGFPGELLDGMYDAARLPWRWRGFAYTQGRLP